MKNYVYILIAHILVFNLIACSSVNSASTTSSLEGIDDEIHAKMDLSHKKLDLEHYIGDQVYFNATFPSEITQVKVDLVFPKNHKLLVHAKPSIELYDKEGELVFHEYIYPDKMQFNVNKKFPDDVIYAKLGIYYCKTGDQGLCLIQNVLYKIKTSEELNPGALDLHYELPES